MICAARMTRADGIPVVADFEQNELPGFATLLSLVDHLILSQDFAAKLTGHAEPRRALASFWTGRQQLAGITCGAQGSFYMTIDKPGQVRHQPAFEFKAVDTTGCGDVFHGAYSLALAKKVAAHERIRFASAVAALKATKIGGAQQGIPSLAQAKQLMSRSR